MTPAGPDPPAWFVPVALLASYTSEVLKSATEWYQCGAKWNMRAQSGTGLYLALQKMFIRSACSLCMFKAPAFFVCFSFFLLRAQLVVMVRHALRKRPASALCSASAPRQRGQVRKAFPRAGWMARFQFQVNGKPSVFHGPVRASKDEAEGDREAVAASIARATPSSRLDSASRALQGLHSSQGGKNTPQPPYQP